MSTENRPEDRESFTGRTFTRKPARSVMFVDRLAGRLIAASGIGSIVAVSLVGLFLVWVVLPLIAPTSIGFIEDLLGPEEAEVSSGPVSSPRIVRQAVDSYGTMAWSFSDDGNFHVRGLAPGQILPAVAVADSAAPTSWAFGGGGGNVVFGFADGTVVTAVAGFENEFLGDGDVPPEHRGLAVGETAVWSGGLLARTPEGQLRYQRFVLERTEPLPLGDGPILLVDVVETPAGMVIVALDAGGVFHDRVLTFKTNLLTGEVRVRSRGGNLDLAAAGLDPAADYARLLVNDTGDLALLVEADGRTSLLRRSPDDGVVLASVQDVTPAAGVTVTAMEFLAGRASLVVGDDAGGLTVWFSVPGGEGKPDLLEPVHRLEPAPAPVTALGVSDRSRIVAAGYADGRVRLYHVTSRRLLGEDSGEHGGVQGVTIAPREDLLLVSAAGGQTLWEVDAPHPETNWHTLMERVWYEGFPEPAHVWQSSAAEDTFEPKLSLVPLIFGTLKATFYSLLFGLPLAVLAAMYTSEFLSKDIRARVKPVIEIMASLPSVVLGFLAALVMAPFVEDVAVPVLAVMVGAPFCVLLGAHLWQMLPREAAARLEAFRPLFVFAALVLGALFFWRTGPFFENLMFAGDFKAWLDGRVGNGVAGWVILLLPASAVLVGWVNVVWGENLIRNLGAGLSLARVGLLDLARFLLSTAAALVLALMVAWMLDSTGWDARGSVFDTYVQRNALVVGIAMGFAVIPIIYTISEDALTAVPDHLRAASLGAGATPWQTLFLVIMPPAMSGLFSAAMIGLGRAVGETMIVLMAAGNTPIMDMNIFNGFRTLSANLAVELPEAVQHSTHYRTLFLAALTLFAMTFVLNTVAEAVRLHFRGKASRL